MATPWTDLYPAGLPRSGERFMDDPYESHVLVTAPIKPGEHVLEVGCSTGYITEFLVKKRGCAVVGIETNAEAAAMAAAGAPTFACTPDIFPDLLAAALQGQDLNLWAARHDLLAARGA